LPFGIVHADPCSLPIAASKAPFTLGREAVCELVEQHRNLNQNIRRFSRKLWFRAGYKLGLL